MELNKLRQMWGTGQKKRAAPALPRVRLVPQGRHICQRGGKTSRIAAMNINLLAVKFSSSSTSARYGLLSFPHSNPTGLGLNPNDNSKHAYETLEKLWQTIQTCELVTVPNIAALEAKLEQAHMPVSVAQMSEETARKMGFL